LTWEEWGGEEFMVYLPGCDKEWALKMGEKMRSVPIRVYLRQKKTAGTLLRVEVPAVESDDHYWLLASDKRGAFLKTFLQSFL
jgi:GGDEF domain-containing protein